MVVSRNESVLIVGAGCFGISTAYHLLQRGFTDITVIDRSERLPAPDAASTDINRIVRTSYSDVFYARLARDAIQEWKKTDEWGDTYRESGVLNLGSQDEGLYASEAYTNDVALGVRTAKFDAADGKDALCAIFPDGVQIGAAVDGATGYLNLDSGWACAARGIELLTARVTALGGKVLHGKPVTGLLRREESKDSDSPGTRRTCGVRLADGSSIVASLVVIASGSWTASTFRDLRHLEEKCLSAGQTIAKIKLTQEEAARYRNVPVIVDWRSGFYIFPPTDDNIIKCAHHASGVVYYPPGNTDADRPVSTPRTVSSHGDDGLRVPRSSLRRLRSSLRGFYPELAEKPFAATRLCWYTDSPDSDWVIGYYPADSGLFVATSGSGHAYKFLPVVGLIVSDAIEGRLDPTIAQKFAVDRKQPTLDRFDLSRGLLKPVDLDAEPLCTPEDLLPCTSEDDGEA